MVYIISLDVSHSNHTDDNHPNHHHHHHHNNNNRRSTSEGSNNGGSGDDSCSSLSSSSSDNIGLKIVKALERMDDNMHLILNRLDSIDSSMKILAVVRYYTSHFILTLTNRKMQYVSTSIPDIVALIDW